MQSIHPSNCGKTQTTMVFLSRGTYRPFGSECGFNIAGLQRIETKGSVRQSVPLSSEGKWHSLGLGRVFCSAWSNRQRVFLTARSWTETGGDFLSHSRCRSMDQLYFTIRSLAD